jgi:hypothetical protein
VAFVYYVVATMSRVEDVPSTAKVRWRLEDGPTPTASCVILITPERQSNANGQAL